MRCTIGEINVICTDAERSLRFYRDVLGFELVEEVEGAYHLRCGEVRFLLQGDADMMREPSRYLQESEFSIDLLVDDLAEAYRHFRAQGVGWMSPLVPGRNSFLIRDPDSLVFEVIQQQQ